MQYWLLYILDIAYIIITRLRVCVCPLGSHHSNCVLSHMGRTFLCVKLHACVCVPQGLTIPAVSSLRECSVSVGWGLRAESLLLLTNRGVSVKKDTHTVCHMCRCGLLLKIWVDT